MADATGSSSSGEDHEAGKLDAQARIDWLEVQLNDLRNVVRTMWDPTSRELRCRRLVVLAEDGFERMTLDSRGNYGCFSIQARPSSLRESGSTCVDVFAHDSVDGEEADVGMALIEGGDVVATLHLLDGRQADLWMGDHDGL